MRDDFLRRKAEKMEQDELEEKAPEWDEEIYEEYETALCRLNHN